ncbi:ester cyclase [Streptomyces meridianus]|uniref:Ester cyclase n=1 Tax=Streptomyces meridianus TaxID=2938945 RepID=A0ABT0XD24_9ACTN|nr:ester cyclase [Streptomyces meridianus]MCM2580422.1 ester cyclase [Streptomyces meridianus]
MTFVQIIDCRTDRVDELNRLMDAWVQQTKGRRTASHSLVGQDRSDPSHVVEIIEFPSYQEAMRNSELPETDRTFREMVSLCDGMPTFTDLDVVRDEQLNKAAARRFFEAAASGDLAAYEELFTQDYHDHDIANETDTHGIEGVVQEVRGYRSAFVFDFDIESQVAEADEVATRWSWRGTHRGDFMGLPATGKEVTMSGVTIFRFRDGKIAEGWWNWDLLGMMRQLGLTAR